MTSRTLPSRSALHSAGPDHGPIASPQAGPHRNLVMVLHRDRFTGAWFVEKIETRWGQMRNLLSFSRKVALHEAFVPAFVAQLSPYLPDTDEVTVTTIPGPAIQLPGCAMVGLRILSQRAGGEAQKVVLRVSALVGRLHGFLRLDSPAEAGTLLDAPATPDRAG